MNAQKMKWIGLAAALFVGTAGCGTPEEDPGAQENQNQNQANQTDPDYDGPTFYQHIQPLMQTHCTGCHVEDSIAPFTLDTFDEVRATAILSHATMEAGTMPPWPPADDCGTFRGRRGMDSEEIALFKEWIDRGMVAGDPANAVTVGQDLGVGLPDRPADLVVDWGFDYQPQPVGGDGIDDYRCFVIDLEMEEDAFVNLVHTRPGNPAQVHHMIAYMAGPNQANHLANLEAEDGRPGYTCFGGPRVNAEMLAGWVPGAAPFPYEEGHGVRVAAGTRLVVQMHYNTLLDPDGTDRTEIELYFVDRDEHPNPRELVILPLLQNGLFVAAGDPDGEAYVESPVIPLNLRLHGIAPHMHTLGTSIYVDALTGDGEMCLINVPDWDFNWQGFYVFEEPIDIPAPVTTRLRCTYDNSAENQAPGREPRDVYWGDGTYDEMCLVYFIIDRPPGL